MKEHGRLIGALVRPVINAAQIERPRAWEDGAAQRNLFADLPAVLVCELASDDATLAVDKKSLFLFRRKQELRVGSEVSGSVDGELGTGIALGDVDAAEPVCPRHAGYPIDLSYPLRIVERQRKGEGDRIARHQPGAGACIGARVPGIEDEVQQAERGDGDDNADDGQDRAQLVPQRILEDQAEQIHEKAVNAAAGGSTKLTATGAPAREAFGGAAWNLLEWGQSRLWPWSNETRVPEDGIY